MSLRFFLLGLFSISSLSVSAAERPLDLLDSFRNLSERANVLKKIQVQAEQFGFVTGTLESRTFEVVQTQESVGMKTVKTEMKISGIPVVGAGMSYHLTANGSESYTADLPEVSPNAIEAKISEREAIAIASLRSLNPLTRKPELKLLPSADRTQMKLVWWVDFRSTNVGNPGVEVVIDAVSGRVIAEISKLHTAAPAVEIYNANEAGLSLKLIIDRRVSPSESAKALRPNNPEVIGCIITDLATKEETRLPVDLCIATVRGENEIGAKACQILNVDARDGSFYAVNPENCEVYAQSGLASGPSDTSAEKALENAISVYEYFSHRFGRESFDGKGTVLRSVVKVGQGWNNAAWLGDLNFMVYGYGDGKEMGDFTQLIDVAGHEMTHGVVNATAKLTMMDEPGALNEATADYFGLQISRYNDWVLGKGLYLNRPEEGIRSLWKPSMYSDGYVDETGTRVRKPNPEKYSERYQTTAECGETNDRCFVHMNSTIMSHGYYWIHRALGKSKTQDLIFLALTQYYRPNTNFHEAANLIREACEQLTVQGRLQGDDCAKVDEALAKVEL